MSAHSSQESAASTMALNAQECESSGNAKPTSSAAESLPDTGPECPAIPTCASYEQPPSSPSMSSAAASPVRTFHSPGAGQVSRERARVFGPNTPDSFASFDPDTSSWRTSQLSLLADSEPSLETWPRAGMTRSGTAFRLRPLAPLTGGIASGLWDAVRREELWPTPSVKGNYNRKGLSAKSGDGLATAVNNWPTPTARLGQARGAQPKRYLDPARSNDLDDAVAYAETFKTPTSAPFSHGGSGGRTAQASGSEWWAVEPPVGRVAHGVPDRLDQLAALGNALVPQIAEWLGRRIIEWESRVAA